MKNEFIKTAIKKLKEIKIWNNAYMIEFWEDDLVRVFVVRDKKINEKLLQSWEFTEGEGSDIFRKKIDNIEYLVFLTKKEER